MKKLLLGLSLACLAAVLSFSAGCNGGDDSDGGGAVTNVVTNAASATLSGSWIGTITQTGNPPGNISMGISQNDDALTGTYQGTGGINGTMAGSITGNAVEMTIVAGGVTTEWTGAANDARTTMSGTFTIVAGGGGNGTWALTKQ